MTVRKIQLLLDYLGYSLGAADGILGPRTAAAVRAFQRSAGLTEDGEPGIKTQEALRQAVCREEPEEDFWSGIRYFTRGEFACKCGLYHGPYCDGYPGEMDRRVVEIADGIRAHFGRPGHIVSGLRCPQHNRDVGGVANSQHLDGTAADLAVDGVSAEQILAFLATVSGVRYAYAINGTNVHFDVPRG